MGRDQFLARVKKAVESGGVESTKFQDVPFYLTDTRVNDQATKILKYASDHWEDLASALLTTAESLGWQVSRCSNAEDAFEFVESVVADISAKNIVITAQGSIRDIGLSKLSNSELDVVTIDSSNEISSDDMRATALRADVGITGVEFAIAETGTAVLSSDSETGRLVGLAPPVHIVIVKRGQVLPSLDELFLLRKWQSIHGLAPQYASLISGPSRSADIEYTLVTGVHGPGDVRMVLVD